MFDAGVIAMRIYYKNYPFAKTPWADLLMSDGVVEHIQWTDAKSRKEFENKITGYTLVYDERPTQDWDFWFKKD